METLDCGHPPTDSPGLGTGYARTEEGKRICYACADDRQREEMRTANTVVAYVSTDGKRVITWSGGSLGTITAMWDGRNHRRYVHVTDVHGAMWHGSGPQESGTYVTLHRNR